MDTTNYTNPNANYFGTPDIPKTITTNNIAQNTPLNLAPAPQDTTNYGAVIASVPSYSDIINQINTVTPQEQTFSSSQSGIKSLINKITGMGGSVDQAGNINTDIAKNTAFEEQLKKFGFQGSEDAYKQFQDITSQVSNLQKEALSIPLQIQEQFRGTGATAGGVAPIQTAQLRDNAIKALSASSIAETLRGNISTASDLAERAVNMQFAPIQAQLNAEMFNYQTNKDALERADKKKADALNFTLQERQRVLNQEIEDKKITQNIVLEAVKNGASKQLIDTASNLSPMKALSVLSGYMSDPTAKAQALANLEKTRAETNKINNEIKSQGLNTTVTNQSSEKYAGAISVVLGSSKLSKDQKNDFIKSVNSGQDPFVVIKNKARELMTGPNATDTQKYETIKEQMNSLDSQLKSYYAQGGKTNIFSGNFEKVLNNLGQVDDPKLVTLAVQIASSLQSYRNAISGTAYSQQEGKDIASIFPGINKSEGLNQAIINGRLAFINDTIDANYRGVLGSTYDTVKQLNIAQDNHPIIQSTQTIPAPTAGTTSSGIKYTIVGQSTTPTTQQTTQTTTQTKTPVTTTSWQSMLPKGLTGEIGGFNLNTFFK